MTKITSALFATTLLTTAQAPASEMRAVEQAVETSTTYFTLPARVPSTVTVPKCDNGCPSQLLQVAANSRFYVNGKPVSYAELQISAAHSGLNVSVFFDPASSTITRIVVFADNR
jgi:hypothetical protein